MISADLPTDRIFELAGERPFLDQMGALFADLDRRVAAHGPVCINRGLCCNFGAYGHKLFVTPAELAYFAAGVDQLDAPTGPGCPHQRGGICAVRSARPAGCRIFFCDAAAAHWQPDESESVLAGLREVHQRYELPYVYVEWLHALRQLTNHRSPGGCVELTG